MVDQISPNAFRALDNNADPEPGAKLFVYETGTTTPVTVYTDSNLTTAHASPILADGNGYFPQIFYGGSLVLKIVITDSNDVTLETLDPALQIGSTGGAASLISFTPSGELTSTNVQDAIEEVQGNIGSNDGSTNANRLVATAGSSNAYVVTAAATITAYANGQRFLLRANHTNTGAATLNVDGLGARDIQKYNASNTLEALAANDILTGGILEVSYDGTRFVLLDTRIQAGTGPNNLVQLDGSGDLPAVSAQNLLDLPQSGGLQYISPASELLTSDQSTITKTGLNYRRVKCTLFGQIAGGSPNLTMQARVSGGTWRTINTFATSGAQRFLVALDLQNFNNADGTGVTFCSFEYASGGGAYDRSSASNVFVAPTRGNVSLEYGETYDEVRFTLNNNNFEGSSSDSATRIVVEGAS